MTNYKDIERPAFVGRIVVEKKCGNTVLGCLRSAYLLALCLGVRHPSLQRASVSRGRSPAGKLRRLPDRQASKIGSSRVPSVYIIHLKVDITTRNTRKIDFFG